MKKISYKRIYKSQEYFSSLGTVTSRALFGGYSLAVDNTVFAMVAEGELYLRVCEESASYLAKHPPLLLRLHKRGGTLQLNYFHVDDLLWKDKPVLLKLGALSLEGARREKSREKWPQRLKDLPNISFHMELLLHDVGIKDSQTLRAIGAKVAWFRLYQLRKQISVSVLFSLEGAIRGVHAAALPAQRRQELREWAESIVKESHLESV